MENWELRQLKSRGKREVRRGFAALVIFATIVSAAVAVMEEQPPSPATIVFFVVVNAWAIWEFATHKVDVVIPLD